MRLPQPIDPNAIASAELAAGAVVGSRVSGNLLVLHHADQDRWCFPKGHVETNETLRDAARREVSEETGLADFDLAEEIGTSSYRFYSPEKRRNVFKTSVYFLAVARVETLEPEPTFDAAEWVSAVRAARLVGFDEERMLAKNAAESLRHYLAARPETSPGPKE